MDGVNGNDIGMLKPGQELRFIGLFGGDFESHKSISQIVLLCQKDFAARTLPKLTDQFESVEPHADFRQAVFGSRSAARTPARLVRFQAWPFGDVDGIFLPIFIGRNAFTQ